MANEALMPSDARQMISADKRLVSTQSGVSPYLNSRRKRIVDLVGSVMLLSVFIFLMIAVMIAIRATSSGPSLFRQARHGRGRGIFHVYKFRSMKMLSEQTFKQAVRHDDRVTKVGRIIRKTSIDEIPQLLNVLKGEMSLVGPRPHPLQLDAEFETKIYAYEERFSARPGMTGLAQVMGARGATPTVGHMRRRICWDLKYVREASLLLDLRIIAMTARELFFDLGRDEVF